ncbi:MAG TPA: SdrD B-like domain-containing protein, partial [Gemmataceae bacterium]
GDSGSPTGERDGSGGVNDYVDSAQANIAVQPPVSRPNSIAGFVFGDSDESGAFSAGDALLPDVLITLVNEATGQTVATMRTDGNGAFSFGNLDDGTYALLEEQPDGWNDGLDFPGSAGGVADDVPGDAIRHITLAGGVDAVNYQFGECPCPPAQLSGFVYEDFTRGVFNAPTKNNGVFDATELGIAGVTVTLENLDGTPVTDFSGNLVGPVVTDANGFYQFTNLHAHMQYRVVETQPAVYSDGKDTPGTTGGDVGPNQGTGTDFITNIPLEAGDNSQNNNFGELFQQVNGFVYEDFTRGNLTLPTFNNGHRDPGELGIAGVTVDLFIKTPAGFLFQGEATTNANGEFFFTDPSAFTPIPSGATTLAAKAAAVGPLAAVAPPNLPPGTYAIVETQPAGYVDGKDTPGSSGGVVGPNQGVGTDFITDVPLALAGDSLDNNFGELPQGNVGALSLAGHVYFDANKDCVFDAGDSRVPGARVHLFRTDVAGGPVEVAQTTTNNLGQYLFEIDTPGTYMVTEDNVAGLIKECAVPGTVNGQHRGTAPAVDDLANITLANGDAGINYDFFLITNPPPFSKQQLLANTPGGAGSTTGVAGATAFATTPSFANIGGLGDDNIMAVGTDAGGPPTVRVFDFTTGKTLFQFNAYDTAFRGGVRVAVADFNGDGMPDIVTAPGAGGGPHIKVFDGKTGALIRQFMAYSSTFTGGVYVAAGDVNGDGTPDIITGAGAGGGPHVRVFDGKTGQVIGSFFAYAPTFAGGVRVAAGDFNQDGKADIVTGAGPGGGPHVRIFNAATLGTASPAVLRQFFAFAPNFTGGVNVAANAFGQGDVTGDGRTDLVVGTGSGAGQVKVIDGASFATVSNFTAFDSSLTTRGVRVGVFDLNGDGRGDVVTTTGGGGPLGAFVRVVDLNNAGGDLDFFQAFNPASLGGAFVAVG